MELSELRIQLDKINNDLLELFIKRMEIAGQVAEYKRINNMPVFDSGRERQILNDIAEKSGEDMRSYSTVLFSMIMELSRAYQHRILGSDSELNSRISKAISSTENLFPSYASVSCQGVEGA